MMIPIKVENTAWILANIYNYQAVGPIIADTYLEFNYLSMLYSTICKCKVDLHNNTITLQTLNEDITESINRTEKDMLNTLSKMSDLYNFINKSDYEITIDDELRLVKKCDNSVTGEQVDDCMEVFDKIIVYVNRVIMDISTTDLLEKEIICEYPSRLRKDPLQSITRYPMFEFKSDMSPYYEVIPKLSYKRKQDEHIQKEKEEMLKQELRQQGIGQAYTIPIFRQTNNTNQSSSVLIPSELVSKTTPIISPLKKKDRIYQDVEFIYLSTNLIKALRYSKMLTIGKVKLLYQDNGKVLILDYHNNPYNDLLRLNGKEIEYDSIQLLGDNIILKNTEWFNIRQEHILTVTGWRN